MSARKKDCPYRCDGAQTIQVLGSGGDYETRPCPHCRPEDANKPDASEYEDGEAD